MPLLQIATDPNNGPPIRRQQAAVWVANQSITAGALATDNNAGGNTNNVTITTGTPAAAGTSGNITLTTGSATGAGISGNIVLTTGTTVGGTRGTVQIVGRLTTTDGIAAGTARIVGGRASSSVADSAAITQAAAGYVAFDQTYSIPANTLGAGSSLYIRAVVRITTVLNGGATFQARLRLGGTALVTSAESTGGAAGTRCLLEGHFTSRAAPGAAVAVSGVSTAIWSDTVAVVTTFPAAAGAVPTFATDGALVVDVAGESSAAGDGSGRIVLEQLIVRIE